MISHLSCCSLGTCSGWWRTAGTCSWRPSCLRTAATNETHRRISASKTSLWSWKQNHQGRQSSVCRQTGLNGSPLPWMSQLNTERVRISSRNLFMSAKQLLLDRQLRSTIWLVGATTVLGNGLITEEVFTVQAAAELLQKTKHIVNAVHHREAEKVLLPIKRSCKSKNRG